MQHQLKIIIILVLVLVPITAQALELTYPLVPGATPPQEFTREQPQDEWMGYYLRYIYHLIVSVVGLAALYTILTGAVKYLVYGWIGQPGKMSLAMGKIRVGLVGAGLTLGSYLAINNINPEMLLFEQDIAPAPEYEITSPDPGQPYREYVEVPLGKIIDQVLDRAKPVDSQAAVVEEAASRVRNQAVCVESLTKQCTCGVLNIEGCECVDPTDCPECTEGQCLGDPCNLEGNLCSGGTGNIRDALEAARMTLSSLTSNLVIEKDKLVAMNNNLTRANENLKIAEDLMRSGEDSGGLWNYMSFIDVKQEEREAEREVRIRELWPWEEDEPYDQGYFSGMLITEYDCQQECSATEEEPIPCCILCDDVLVCHGNDFKCDEGNSESCDSICESDERFPVSDHSDFDSGGWPSNDLPETIMYNGESFPVPSGGVQFCDLNQKGCGNNKCEDL